jgi:hypothetical protein
MAWPQIGRFPVIPPKSEKKQLKRSVAAACKPRSDRVHGLGRTSFSMLKRLALTPVILVAAALAVAAPSQAQVRPGAPHVDFPFQRDGQPSSQWDVPRRERLPEEDNEKSLSEILRMLKGQYGGQHLDARKVGAYYMISWITDDGRRLNLRVNAKTGRVE